MSSDFGDDSGEAMLRWAERVGERGGARALIEAAGRLGGSAAEVRERPHGTSVGPGCFASIGFEPFQHRKLGRPRHQN